MWFVFSINPFSHHQCKSQGFINVLHSTLSVSLSLFRFPSTRELSSSNLSVLNNILFVYWGRVCIWMRQPQLKSPDWDVYAVFCCMPVCEWDRDSSVAIVFHLSDIYLIGRLIIKVKHFFHFISHNICILWVLNRTKWKLFSYKHTKWDIVFHRKGNVYLSSPVFI